MLKDFAEGFKKIFSVAGKFLILALLCLALGLGIVFPLWKWATVSPKIYTWIMLGLFLVGILYLIFSSIRKNGIVHFLIGFVKIALILSGLALCIFFVLKSNRILALVVLLAALILFSVAVSVESLLKRKQNRQEPNF